VFCTLRISCLIQSAAINIKEQLSLKYKVYRFIVPTTVIESRVSVMITTGRMLIPLRKFNSGHYLFFPTKSITITCRNCDPFLTSLGFSTLRQRRLTADVTFIYKTSNSYIDRAEIAQFFKHNAPSRKLPLFRLSL
jgi:hypothetical protein